MYDRVAAHDVRIDDDPAAGVVLDVQDRHRMKRNVFDADWALAWAVTVSTISRYDHCFGLHAIGRALFGFEIEAMNFSDDGIARARHVKPSSYFFGDPSRR